MKIYLVRHGLTRWNKTGRYAGWSDVPLSPAGVEQAEHLARYFSGLGPFALYASDLKRTVITAEIIGRGRGISPAALPGPAGWFAGPSGPDRHRHRHRRWGRDRAEVEVEVRVGRVS